MDFHSPTIEEVYCAIRGKIDDPEQQRLWDEFSSREQAKGKGYARITAEEMRRHDEFSRLKEEHTGLKVPQVAAVNGFGPVQVDDPCKTNVKSYMHFPCNLGHPMGPDTEGPHKPWKNRFWVDADGNLIEEQCATGEHYAKVLSVGGFVDDEGHGSVLEDLSGKTLL